MNALASTVRSKTNDLLLIDANYFSQDAGSFSHLTAISNASYVFHYYTCQAAGQCTSTQESCATNASALGDDFGAADVQANPVVIDEFGWPQGSTGSDGIEMENVASFVSNAFLPGYLPNGLVYPNDAGWAAFQWGGPNDNGTGTWSLANETGGYTPNDNGVPVEDAMNGSYPSPCT